MNIKAIKRMFLLCFIMLFAFTTTAYCEEGTSNTRMKIDGSASWNNITIGEAYLQCEKLNTAGSTLGTDELEAHLTTDYDYNAMALFAVSQYGGRTSQQSAKHESINR